MPVVAISMSGGSTAVWGAVAAALALIGLAAQWGAWRRVRGTTLTASWGWALASLACLTGTELVVACLGDSVAPAAVEAARFAAAVSIFCPAMAVFGSKRPQHVAWQFIVLSLWCVLVLPSGEALLFARGGLEVDVVRSWFLLILIGMTFFNWLPTRFAPSALLIAWGQLTLLWKFLPLPSAAWMVQTPPWGISLVVAAGVLFAIGWPRPGAAATSLDQAWRDFRDLYGAAWSLRVAQRVNATSAAEGWGTTLTWQGFGINDETKRDEVERNFVSLLRRFVSSEWIAARLGSVGSIPTE